MTELRIGSPVVIAGVTLIPVERLIRHSYSHKRGFGIHIRKDPELIVVCGRAMRAAFDVDGVELRLADLIRDIEGLEAVIDEHCP